MEVPGLAAHLTDVVGLLVVESTGAALPQLSPALLLALLISPANNKSRQF